MERFAILLGSLCVLNVLFEPSDAAESCTDYLYQFTCNDSTCLRRIKFCDGTPQCSDGSDEILYDKSTHNKTHGFECNFTGNDANKACLLPLQYRCDHEMDCVGGEDECGCPWTFQCDNGDCALRRHFCDGRENCGDGSDERVYNKTGFQCLVTKTHHTRRCKLPDVHVCDGASECSWGTDECFCDFSAGPNGRVLDEIFSNEKCFRCLDGSLIIPSNQVCDKIVHCNDLSDECLCDHKSSSSITDLCRNVCTDSDCDCPGRLQCYPKSGDKSKKICIPPDAICNGSYDCDDELDERFCAMTDELFGCHDRTKKIRNSLVCDGRNDCEDGSDEWKCHETMFICGPYRYYNMTIDWNDPQKAPRPNRTTVKNPLWPYYAKPCDGIPLCTFMGDECNNPRCPEGHNPEFCNELPPSLACPNSETYITGYQVCDGHPTCNDTAPETSADEKGCPRRFYCTDHGAKRLPIHIPIEHRCDGKQECDDVSDEMGCSNETHYYCNDSGVPLFIPVEQKCDKRKDCAEGGDECEDCEESIFSSDQKLIKSRVLIVFLWILGIFATVGNLTIIIHQIVNIMNMKRDASHVAVRNRTMVLNLAVADLLTGVYLIALGIKDAMTDKYCLEDQDWRSSATCSGLGTIAVIGTEASVLILLVMTADRLLVIYRPYERQRLSSVLLALLFVWVFAIILGTAPYSTMARDYFLSCVWFRTHRYLGYTCREKIVEFTKKLITYEGPDMRFSAAVGSEFTWESMLAAQEALNPEYVPDKYFGYYSAHSVCLPRFFPDKENDRSWSYSMFLVLLNFFAFLFILMSYFCIYKQTIITGAAVTSTADRTSILQRKISRIILTDFCCWMPICIMAFITVSGVDIGAEAYAVTAIILLPINSAMNPFLYSSLLDMIWKKLTPVRKCFGAGPCGTFNPRQWSRSNGGRTVVTVLSRRGSDNKVAAASAARDETEM